MIPKIKPMYSPKTRAEFELRFYYLQEALQNGKFMMAHNNGESLLNVKKLPNGRLDFLSVDEQARLQANMSFQVSNFKDEFQDGEEQESPSGN